jgi:cytochrome c-type biogenesis protein CcmH
VFLLVVGIGLVSSRGGTPHQVAGPGGSSSLPQAGPDAEALARLKDYTRSLGHKESPSAPANGKLLPDVNVMIERLAARLESAPNDIKGWRMLGWSYFHTERYQEAAAAYAKAVALDPSSTELKASLEEAKAKSSGLRVDKGAKSEATPSLENDAAIRAMVDGLANRLEGSPRDVEGWTRLMRSRVVLGERERAAAALRKALEVFKDDQAASGRIAAAANELGLKAE